MQAERLISKFRKVYLYPNPDISPRNWVVCKASRKWFRKRPPAGGQFRSGLHPVCIFYPQKKIQLKASRRKIFVFLFAVLTLVTIAGSMLYVVEGGKNGFTSIPRSIYWAIVTLTTVGFGDIAPQTGLGQALASIIMILGYGIIAVPTGIVSYEMSQSLKDQVISPECSNCHKKNHDMDAAYCKYCETELLK